jgi:hypothetical protein
MANAIVAEGFNRDPITGRAVYQGLFTRDGGGNVLAVNAAVNGGIQAPYPLPDAVPLAPRDMLRRPESDPIVVDMIAYTDFFRLRASIYTQASSTPGGSIATRSPQRMRRRALTLTSSSSARWRATPASSCH